MEFIKTLFLQWGYLSLDAPTIATAWLFVFHRVGQTKSPEPGHYLLLFLAVWLAYVGDRLLDARKKDPALLSHRHSGYIQRKNRLSLLWLFGFAFATGAGLLILPMSVFLQALGLGGFVIIYLLFVQWLPANAWPLKKIATGLLFAAGVGFFAWKSNPAQVDTLLHAQTGFFLLCMWNLWLIRAMECADLTRKRPPGSQYLWGAINLFWLLAVGINHPMLAVCYLSSSLGLLLLSYFKRKRLSFSLFRQLADAALLLAPLLVAAVY